MKIRRLELKAFGPFTDKVLDFAGGQPGLHVIYGPNEAGKSSTLRALKNWLYGFDHLTRDSFIHPNEQLLVAGLLENARGEQLYFARRKRRKANLLDGDGNPMDQAALEAMLHGIDREVFEKLFGLDHDALVQGGTAILQEQGGAGTTLFAAGTGIASLQQVMAGLQAESDEIFKGRASKPLLNAALRTFSSLKSEIAKVSLSSRQWKEHDKAFREARRELEQERQKRGELDRERRRLERIQQSLQPLGLRQGLRQRLADLQDVLPLPADFSTRRAENQDRLRSAGQSLHAAEGRLKEFTQKVEGVRLNVALLDQAQTVGHLYQRLGEYRKALKEKPALEATSHQEQSAAQSLLRKIRPEIPLQQAETLRPLLRRQRGIKDFGAQWPLLQQKSANADRELRNIRGELEQVESALVALAAPLDRQPLKTATDRALRMGDVDTEISRCSLQLAQARSRFEAELRRVGRWFGSPAELLALELPLAETVGRFQEHLRGLEEQRRTLGRQREELQQEHKRLTLEISAIEKAGEVPTEKELEQQRALRDLGWQLLRRQWLDGEDVGTQSKAYHPELALPEAYEQNLTQADATADRLRREAERVHKYADRLAEHEAALLALKALADEEQALCGRFSEHQRQWQERWQPCAVEPLPPSEMAGWLSRIDKLRLQAEKIIEDEKRLQVLADQRRHARGQIEQELSRIQAQIPPGEELTPLLLLAQDLQDRMEATESQRRTLQDQKKSLSAKMPAAEEEARAARAALERYRQEWAAMLQEMGLPEKSSPGEADDFFADLASCLDHLEKAKEVQTRMALIKRDTGQFESEVKALVRLVAADLMTLPVDQAVEQVNGLVGRAKEQQVFLKNYREGIEQAEAEIRKAKTDLQSAEAQLGELCGLAGCAGPEELEAAERRWQERVQLEERILEVEEQLGRLAEGKSIADLESQAHQVDPDELPARLKELAEELAQVDQRIGDLAERVGEERKELERMDGSADAAQKAEEAEECLAQVRRLAERYARLRIAARVLEDEIERYRAENQDPVLALAGGYFGELTLNSFEGLRTDIGDRGEEVIVGLRNGGDRIGVEGMSDGTRDQLYLALRLASLEHRLEKNEAMPFIVDDILVNFDDARSEATLKALARLGQKNQVILFTHHREVAEAVKVTGGDLIVLG